MALPFLLPIGYAIYLARPCSYHRSFKNCRDDMHIEMGYQLRVNFQAGGLVKERRIWSKSWEPF
jgi:hypothetical protein